MCLVWIISNWLKLAPGVGKWLMLGTGTLFRLRIIYKICQTTNFSTVSFKTLPSALNEHKTTC